MVRRAASRVRVTMARRHVFLGGIRFGANDGARAFGANDDDDDDDDDAAAAAPAALDSNQLPGRLRLATVAIATALTPRF